MCPDVSQPRRFITYALRDTLVARHPHDTFRTSWVVSDRFRPRSIAGCLDRGQCVVSNEVTVTG